MRYVTCTVSHILMEDSAEFRQRSIVGEPLLAFFGYEVLGVYQNDS